MNVFTPPVYYSSELLQSKRWPQRTVMKSVGSSQAARVECQLGPLLTLCPWPGTGLLWTSGTSSVRHLGIWI